MHSNKSINVPKKLLFNTSKARQTIFKELQMSSLSGIKHADDLLNEDHFFVSRFAKCT